MPPMRRNRHDRFDAIKPPGIGNGIRQPPAKHGSKLLPAAVLIRAKKPPEIGTNGPTRTFTVHPYAVGPHADGSRNARSAVAALPASPLRYFERRDWRGASRASGSLALPVNNGRAVFAQWRRLRFRPAGARYAAWRKQQIDRTFNNPTDHMLCEAMQSDRTRDRLALGRSTSEAPTKNWHGEDRTSARAIAQRGLRGESV